jgi:hypothetical protein
LKKFFLSHRQAHLTAFVAAYFLVDLAVFIQKKIQPRTLPFMCDPANYFYGPGVTFFNQCLH